MSARVLIVDDDANLLAGCKRSLGRAFKITTAEGGAAGLRALDNDGPFAVVISDMRMPEMDGVEFITEARKKHRDTVYMMLTGNADQQTAVDAVNKGHVFRFLNKPCPAKPLTEAINAALRQHELVTAEKELLKNTLSGSIRVLRDLLGLTDPTLFAQSDRVNDIVKQLAGKLDLPGAWQYGVAASLAQIGMLTLPREIIEKHETGAALDAQEQELFDSHAAIGKRLIARIPRLERVAEMIESQRLDPYKPEEIALEDPGAAGLIGGQMIRLATELDALITTGGATPEDGVETLRAGNRGFDPRILEEMKTLAFNSYVSSPTIEIQDVAIKSIKPGMVLEDDLVTSDKLLLVPSGRELTQTLIERIRNYHRMSKVEDTIRVGVPVDDDAQARDAA